MNKFITKLLVGVLFVMGAVGVNAQVTTTVTMSGGPIAGSPFTSLAEAVTAINGLTITGPVVATAEAGNETAPAGTGYYITATGTVTNTIIIQGTTTTTITAGANTAAGVFDAVFKIIGGDYITIQNFTMNENTVANTVTTVGATNTMTEAGVLIIHASATDGAQNNTIQNNVINLSTTYTNSVGVLSTSSSTTSNASPGASTTLDATSTAGTNSNNKIYGNTITNVQYGILFICPPITAAIFETGNEIGGSTLSTGNTITFGFATASSGPWYRSQSTVQAGIYYRNGAGNSIRFNSVTSNTATYVGSAGLNGIISSGTAPVGVTYTSTISDNTVNITTTGIALLTGIDFGYGISTGTIVGSNNTVTLTQTGAVTNSAAVIGIKGSYASAAATASSNSVTFNQTFTPIANTQTNSSAFTGVTISGASTTLNANSNIVTVNQLVNPGTTITAATLSGQMACVTSAGAANTVNTNSNKITVNQTAQPGGTTATATISSTVLGVNSSVTGNAGGVYTSNYNRVDLNQLSNITASGAATASLTGQFNGIQIGGNNAAGGATTALGDTVILSRSVTQIAGQTTTLGSSTTAFIGISATVATTTLTVGSVTASDQNIIQVRDGTSANGTVTYQSGSVTMLSLGNSLATTSAPASVANVLGNRLNTGSTVSTTTGSTVRSTGTFSGITIPNQGSLNTVNNNVIIIDRLASGGSVFGYQQSTSPSELADSIKGNTITFTSLTGAAAPTGISALGGSSGTITSKNVNENIISISGTHTGTSTGFANNYSFGTFANNSITISSVSPTVIGVNFNGSSAGEWKAAANTLSLTSSTTSPTSMIGISGSAGGPFKIFNNTFSAMNFTGIITGAPVVSGVAVAVGTLDSVYNNVITNISVGAATSTATPVVDGILISGGVSVNAFKNKIYGITTAATGATAVVNGVRISGGGTTANSVYNNLIGDLTASAATNPDAIRGISITSTTVGTTNNIYYNTVNLSGAGGTNFGGTGIFHAASTVATTATLNFRNNIIVNNLTPNGTGLVTCFRRSAAATLGNYGASSNNNDFYTTTGSVMHDGTTAFTIATFKAAVATRDAGSFAEDPEFQSTTGSSDDFLKYKVSSAKQIESGAVNIALYTDDYGGTIRFGNAGYVTCVPASSSPDIGAWELCGIAADLTGPSISYTTLSNTSCTTDRTLSSFATITDGSGVNTTAGTNPRIYYKKSTDADDYVGNTSSDNGWKYTEATNASSPFDFTINVSKLQSPVVTTDTIQYFVVAQDNAGTPNVGINSGIFAATPTSVALTTAAFPLTGTINSYAITPAGLSGTVNVGAAETFKSLTEVASATGIFANINANGLSGNTTIVLMDASITETGATALNVIASSGCSGGTFTLLIKPNTTSTLTGSVASGALIKIASKYVTIDGSNTAGGTTRDLTITNTSTTTPNVILIGNSGTSTETALTNVTLKNTILINGVNTATAVIVANNLAAAGYFNTITIQNNSVQKAYIGIYALATAATGNGSGLLITGNDLNATSPNALSYTGIFVQGVDSATVSNNNIANITSSTLSPYGVVFTTGTNKGSISGNTISALSYTGSFDYAPSGIVSTATTATNISINDNIISDLSSSAESSTYYSTPSGINISSINTNAYNNKIFNIKQTNTGGEQALGINLSSASTTSGISVYNNFIFDIAGYGYSSIYYNGHGIGLLSGGGYNLYNNTINMNTNQTTATGYSAAIYISSSLTTAASVNIRNNIFANTQTGGAPAANRYAIYCAAANTIFGTIDHNDYYTSGTHLGYRGSNRTTLADIVTGFGGNANSISALPTFTSATDLHLTTANCTIDNKGTVISGVTTDIDNQTRDLVTPDMGADEFSSAASSTLYNTSSTTITDTRTVASLEVFRAPNCERFAALQPNGASPVSGSVTARVYKYATVQTYNSEPYVQRVIDITPATGASSATGIVTLYYTQTEFDDFNTANGAWPDLPTSSSDATGIANLRITKYAGTPNVTPSAPGTTNYSGGTSQSIDPVDADIVWNVTDSRWEITLNNTGFSGFYIHTGLIPLAISVNYLTGTKQGTNHNLNWKVTCTNSPSATMVLERSGNNRGFMAITTITADAVRCAQPFNYVDASPLVGINYYRLRITDAFGKVTYSNTIAMVNKQTGIDIVGIVPNPVTNNSVAILNVASAQKGILRLVVTDVTGRQLMVQTEAIIAGSNQLPLNVAKLAAGSYQVTAITEDGKSTSVRFIKQ